MMNERIDLLLQKIHQHELMESAQALTYRYRALEKPYLRTYPDYLAYVVTRQPATLAAISAVLKQIPENIQINSFLDLGAGPGTGYMAAKARFPSLGQSTLIETDPNFIEIGQTLIPDPVIWQARTLPCALDPHDLVLLSYSLGEMQDPESVLMSAFAAAKEILVLIEPGTPLGYERVMRMRQQLLGAGAHMVAPCPHAAPCPMTGTNWCHFPARVARSKLHMQLKSGTLGYEDEKYSYLIVSKTPLPLPHGRIVDKVIQHKGHLDLMVCAEEKLSQITVSKRDGALYKHYKKAVWGDPII